MDINIYSRALKTFYPKGHWKRFSVYYEKKYPNNRIYNKENPSLEYVDFKKAFTFSTVYLVECSKNVPFATERGLWILTYVQGP